MSVTKRLAEIQERKKQIRAEAGEAQRQMDELEAQIGEKVDEAVEAALEGLETKIEGLSEEIDTLTGEEEELQDKKEAARSSMAAPAIVRSRGSGSVAEQRGRELQQQRAVTIAGGSLTKKVGASDEIAGLIGSGVSSIVDLVKMKDMVGLSGFQEPYEASEPTGEKTQENTEAAQGDVTFGYAEIKPVTVAIYTEISREAKNLNAGAYYDTVVNAARRALRRKVSAYIVNGDAVTSPTFVGITQAAAISAASDLPLTKIDAGTLRQIAFYYGGEEDVGGEGVLFLNKADLIAFGDVRGTNEKKAIYEITPDSANTNTGIIKDGGLSMRYCLNTNISALSKADTEADAFTMFYGVPSFAYECGVFGDYTVRVSEDAAFRRRMIAVLGEVSMGGNVIVKDGFVRVKKGA